MLTIEKLQGIAADTIFASGLEYDAPGGLNMSDSGKQLRWVAVRGYGPTDWTIYCHWATSSEGYVKHYGDKVTFESHIRSLVPCDDDAFRKYRY